MVGVDAVDFGIVLVQLLKFDGVRGIFIYELKAEPYLFPINVYAICADLLYEGFKLHQVQTSLLLVEVIEYLPKAQLVFCNDSIQLFKAILYLAAHICRYPLEGLISIHLLLKTRHRIELAVNFNAVIDEDGLELICRDGAAIISVCFAEHIVSFFFGDVGVNVPEEMIEILEIYLFLALTKPKSLHHLFHVQVFLCYVKTKLIHNHLHFILELPPARCLLHEKTIKNMVHKNLVPRNSVRFPELQASF